MKKLKIVILAISLILISIFAVVFTRTLMFTTKQVPVAKVEHVGINKSIVTEHLSKGLEIKTVTYDDPSEIDYRNLITLRDYIDTEYPFIHKDLKRTIINDYSLLYEWQGTNSNEKPIIITAHMDVVPEGDEKWEVDPFKGIIKDGYIWGRGALDDKGSLFSILESVEFLIKSGFKPERTIYLAFGHDEEAGTYGGVNGARKIAEYLKNKGVHAEVVLDEGGIIVDENLSFVKGKKFALVAIAEKGYLTLKLTAQGGSGHSMMPPKDSSIVLLSKAILDLNRNKMHSSINDTIGLSFDYFGPEMPFFQKMLFANKWLFGNLIKVELEKNKLTAAMMHTTVAPTIIQGGIKENSLPASAYAIVNFRIIPGETSQDVVNHVRSSISDTRVKVEQFGTVVHEPSRVSEVDSRSYNTLYKSIREIFPDVMVAPVLSTGRSDAIYYEEIADNVYRFTPAIYSPGDDKRPHGVDERISIDAYIDMIQFYIRFITNNAGNMK